MIGFTTGYLNDQLLIGFAVETNMTTCHWLTSSKAVCLSTSVELSSRHVQVCCRLLHIFVCLFTTEFFGVGIEKTLLLKPQTVAIMVAHRTVN